MIEAITASGHDYALDHSPSRLAHLAHRKSYVFHMFIIGPNSHEKLTKSEIRSKVMRSTEIQYRTYCMCFI